MNYWTTYYHSMLATRYACTRSGTMIFEKKCRADCTMPSAYYVVQLAVHCDEFYIVPVENKEELSLNVTCGP